MAIGIYIVRHCHAAGQQALDAPLTETGKQQAEELAERLADKGIARIVSSPYVRAHDSVAPLARRLGLPVETDARLMERVLRLTPCDDWQEQLAASFVDMDMVCQAGAESSREAMTRGVAAIEEILSANVGPTVVATHGQLMTLILKHFDDAVGFAEWKALTNPDVYCIETRGGVSRAIRLID